jgi:hypothetical protein
VVDKRGRVLGEAFALARVVLHILDGAALRSDLCKHLGEGALGRVVGRVVVVLHEAALPKPPHHTQRHTFGEDVELRAARRLRRHEPRLFISAKTRVGPYRRASARRPLFAIHHGEPGA